MTPKWLGLGLAIKPQPFDSLQFRLAQFSGPHMAMHMSSPSLSNIQEKNKSFLLIKFHKFEIK